MTQNTCVTEIVINGISEILMLYEILLSLKLKIVKNTF